MVNQKWESQKPIRLKQIRIAELKSFLSDSDYKAIKYAEGLISETDYDPIKSERQKFREEINQLEAEISELTKDVEGAAE